MVRQFDAFIDTNKLELVVAVSMLSFHLQKPKTAQ